jgi:hypothetical protein
MTGLLQGRALMLIFQPLFDFFNKKPSPTSNKMILSFRLFPCLVLLRLTWT